MDVITRYAAEIFHLFFPERCPACGKALPEGVSFLCPTCQWEMPLTGYCTEHDNPVARKFWGLVPIEEASSLFFFSSHSPYRNLIHNFKYRGQWRVCEKMGIWFGKELRESGLYDEYCRSAHALVERRLEFPVAESEDIGFSEIYSQSFNYLFCERPGIPAGENFQFMFVMHRCIIVLVFSEIVKHCPDIA